MGITPPYGCKTGWDVAGNCFFTSIYLTKAYWQVPVGWSLVPTMAVVTSLRCFEFVVMLFGVKNTGSTFQQLIDTCMDGMPFVFCYMDDPLVFSNSLRSHKEDVKAVLTRLRNFGLVYIVRVLPDLHHLPRTPHRQGRRHTHPEQQD